MEVISGIVENWQTIVGSIGAIFTGFVTLMTTINKFAPKIVSDTMVGKLTKKTDIFSLGSKQTKIKKIEE